MAQAIDKELFDYIEKLNTNQKKSLLDIVKSYLQVKDKIKALADYNAEIDASIARMNAGKYINHDDVESEAAKW